MREERERERERRTKNYKRDKNKQYKWFKGLWVKIITIRGATKKFMAVS